MKSSHQGGLDFPNLSKYYLAAQLHLLAHFATLQPLDRVGEVMNGPSPPKCHAVEFHLPNSATLLFPMALPYTLCRAQMLYSLTTTVSLTTSFSFSPGYSR